METKNLKDLNEVLDSLLDIGWKLSYQEMLYVMKTQPNLYSYFEGIDLIKADWLLGKPVLIRNEYDEIFMARVSEWKTLDILTCIDAEDDAWDIYPEEIVEILED